MKESYSESIASYTGPESYADGGNIVGVATTGVYAGKLLSSEIFVFVCRRRPDVRKATWHLPLMARQMSTRPESKNLSMRRNSKRENRESPEISQGTFFDLWERSENASGGTADMIVSGQSDESVVPSKLVNKDETESSAESVEGRLSANGNAQQTASSRTPSRVKRESRGLEGVREAARNSSTLRFTALLHHIDER